MPELPVCDPVGCSPMYCGLQHSCGATYWCAPCWIPLGVGVTLGLAGGWMLRRGRRRRSALLVGAGTALLCLGGVVGIGGQLVR